MIEGEALIGQPAAPDRSLDDTPVDGIDAVTAPVPQVGAGAPIAEVTAPTAVAHITPIIPITTVNPITPADPSTPSFDDTPVNLQRPRHRRWRRRVVRTALVIFGLLFVYYVISFAQVWSRGNDDEARNVDAIIVLGAAQYDGRPSPQLAARLDHSAELFKQGDAPLIVVTGGKLAGDRFTEAQASAAYLAKQGVPRAAIVQVGVGHNTYDSMVAVEAVLKPRGLQRVLIVTDPYHTLRSELIASDLGMTTFVSPTRTSPVHGSTAVGRELSEAGGVAIGRIIGFHRLSDLVN